MCTEVLVILPNGTRVYCETVGHLAAVLGVRQHKVSDDGYDCCLCNAKWEELGARDATDAEGWPLPEYVIELTGSSAREGRGGG